MVKHKTGDAREEISLELKDGDLTQAKKIAKAFGCAKAIWMHRLKEVYEYKGIEWALVIAPANIRYYEAELVVGDETKIENAKEKLSIEAKTLGLEVLDDEQTRVLIERLDREANKEVEL